MGRLAIEASQEVGRLLRDERERRGWTLRDVEERCRDLHAPMHFTTLARIERGQADPGLRRLHVLLKIFDLPFRLVEDLLELEAFASGEADTDFDYDKAITAWRSGDLRKGFAGLAALRAQAADEDADPYQRQRATVGIAVTVGSLGRYHLARHLIEELLLEPPLPSILPLALLEAAVCWHWLGSGEVALGFLARAEANTPPDAHRERAMVHHERASTYASMGRSEDAETALTQAIADYRKARDTFGEGQAMGVRIRMLEARGDHVAVLAEARKARKQAKRHGHGRLEVHRTLDEGLALFKTGSQQEGLSTIQKGLGQALADGDQVSQFYGHYYLWKAYREQGDSERAAVELGAARYFQRFVDAATPAARAVINGGDDVG